MNPRISLDQWRALVAVVEAGGYAQAATKLHKTQSSVSYLVQKIERLLDVKLFELDGRKAQLTAQGQALYHRARTLIDEAAAIERAAGTLAAGWEPDLRLAVDIVFPTWLVLRAFVRFAQEHPETRLHLFETVLGGTDEALLERRVDLAINGHIPPGYAGDPLVPMRFIAAAHPEHPLHKLGRPLTLRDLRKHRHLIVRDSGMHITRDAGGFKGAEQRWTFSHKATSIFAAAMGLGFAWYPEEMIRGELQRGVLKPLPLREGAEHYATLYLILADGDAAGPGVRRMAEILKQESAHACAAVRAQEAPAAAPASRTRPARGASAVRRARTVKPG